jgi:N-acetylmuramoyl-L-alanine amidase
VAITRVKDGVLQVSISAPGGAIGAATMNGTTLFVPFQTGLTDQTGLPINTAGVRSAYMDATGLKLDLLQAPAVSTISQGPGALVLELRTTLAGLSWQEASDRSILGLNLKGSVVPKVTEDPTGLTLTLPGATVATGVTAPMGVGITPTADGLTLKIASKRAYALKRTVTGFELDLYKPGLAGKQILLDPGHGGYDSGAVANATTEKIVNLQVALRVRAMLAAKGAIVKMTRIDDRSPAPDGIPSSLQPDLLWRSRMANETNVDLFLSIHHNSGSSAAKGVEAFYSSTSLNAARSRQFANLVFQGVVAAGQMARSVDDDQYFVTRNTEAPNSLVEIAYLTNPDDAARARDPQFQDRVATQIVNAMERFWAGEEVLFEAHGQEADRHWVGRCARSGRRRLVRLLASLCKGGD